MKIRKHVAAVFLLYPWSSLYLPVYFSC